VIDATVALPDSAKGSPLLDATGRVVGVATGVQQNGAVRLVGIPESWTRSKVVERAPERNAESLFDAPATKAAPAGLADVAAERSSKVPISAERQEALRKTYRPDPNLPPDL
jgi:erythromycin esterase-like protein